MTTAIAPMTPADLVTALRATAAAKDVARAALKSAMLAVHQARDAESEANLQYLKAERDLLDALLGDVP